MKDTRREEGVRQTGGTGRANAITEGVIWKQLLLFFFPILFGTFFQQLYNTADAVVVGRFVGKEALAAVGGSTSMLTNLLVGFFVGLSSGATVIIAQFYGAGRGQRVSEAVHTAIAFSLLCGILMTVGGLLFSDTALRLMGTPEDIMDNASGYLHIYFVGITANLLYNMGAGILRAIGDSKRPFYFLVISCFTNIALDLLFVVGLRMGVRGAAVATILSQVVSACLVLGTLMRADGSYRFEIRKTRITPVILVRIIRIGFPAGLQSVMYSFSNLVIQSSVNALGTDTVAAWAAYGKIDSTYWMIINALGISITTFVGQNYGAGRLDRVKRSVYVCLGISCIITVGLSTILYLTGGYIYLLFTTDAEVIAIGMKILHFLVPAFVTYLCIEIYSGALRGVGDCWIPMIMTALGVCVLRVVWILIAVPIRPDILTVVFSYPLTWTITTVLFNIYYYFFSALKKWNVPLPLQKIGDSVSSWMDAAQAADKTEIRNRGQRHLPLVRKRGRIMGYEPMNESWQMAGERHETLGQYVAKTYLWMFAGLLVTFGIALAGYVTGAILYVFQVPYATLALTGLELLTVIWLSARIHKLSVGAARGLFLFYAALNGVVFSMYFLIFGVVEMVFVFAATALFFGMMAGVSLIFKLDLSGIRPLLVGGLLFLILFGLLSMFLNLGSFETVLCYAGIVVFLGFTAYDTTKIRDNYQIFSADPELLQKASVFSALQLYLDFINLFLYIIRLMNRNRK